MEHVKHVHLQFLIVKHVQEQVHVRNVKVDITKHQHHLVQHAQANHNVPHVHKHQMNV